MSRIESAAGLKGASAAAEVTSPNTAHAEAAQVAATVQASAQGQYISPVVTVDNSSGLAIIQYRDGQTGETEVQWPSPKAVQQYIKRSVEEAQNEPTGEKPSAEASGQRQAPVTEAESAPATQQAQGTPAEGSTAPQSGGATAHVSLIA